MKEKDEEIIKKLKDKLSEQELSFVVGAGFSKNVSDKFLDWKGLLKDMILEMYREEIESSFARKNFTSIDEHKENKIQEIIDRVGYLGIASEYTRRKGYREAMDLYIEERTPYLVKEGKNYILKVRKNGEIETVDVNPDISVHMQLLSTGAKYIYTFNYDTLLDELGNSREIDDLYEKGHNILSYKEGIEQLKNQLDNIYKSIETHNNQTNILTNIPEYEPSGIINKINALVLQINYLELISINNIKIHTQEQELPEKDFYDKEIRNLITSIDNNIKGINRKKRDKYQVVDCSSKISLTENQKSIFKLHGSLRNQEVPERNGHYGFDGDIRKQYIICQEDYDTYSKDHDAFVSLMKIALLKGSFCIIGFSADDPNFLSWLSWVREVLSKGPDSTKNNKDERLFYIDASNKELSTEKKLLFSLHHITPIQLHEWYPNQKDEKNRIISFLSELNSKDRVNGAWKKTRNSITLTECDLQDISKIIWESLSDDRLPLLNNQEHHARELLISNNLTDLLNLGLNELLSKIIYAAIKEEMIPLDLVKNSSQLLNQLPTNNCEIKEAFELLDLRSKVLSKQSVKINNHRGDKFHYERILQLAFDLNFKDMKSTIECWVPKEEHWKPKRFALLFIFEPKKVSVDFDSYMDGITGANNQERIYTLDIWARSRTYINFDKINRPNPEIQNEIQEIIKKDSHLHRYGDNIEILTGLLKKEDDSKKNVYPYATTFRNFNTGTSDSQKEYAAQLLQTFIEIGIPFHNDNTIILDKENWYSAFQYIFIRYPYPCLYFSLQYGKDEQFMTRIAQDYIYSIDSTEVLSDLLNKMLDAYQMEETPVYSKKGIAIASAIFMKRVHSSNWGERFKTIYNNFDFSDNDENRSRLNPVYDFFLSGIRLMEDAPFRMKVIADCLKKKRSFDDYHNSMMIEAVSGKKTRIPARIQSLVNEFIDIADQPAQYYALLNLQNNLSKKQINAIRDKFINLDYTKNNDAILLEAVSKIFANQSVYQEKLKPAILNSPHLWSTGISDGFKISFPITDININNIQNNIIFSEVEINYIFSKLKLALQQIQDCRNNVKNLLWISWEDTIFQMKEFLFNNKAMLENNPEYHQIVDRVKEAYIIESGFTSIYGALASQDTTVVQNGLTALYQNISIFGEKVGKYKTEYIFICTKIIFKEGFGIQRCFIHLAWSFEKYYEDYDQDIFQPLIEQILISYQSYYLGEKNKKWDLPADKDVIEKALIRIYDAYKKGGKTIIFWKEHKPIYF